MENSPQVNKVNMESTSAIKIGKKAFLSSAIITFCLMIVSGILTQVIPSGIYERIVMDGQTLVKPDSFQYIQKIPFPIYRWFTAPFEVLFSSDGLIAIMLIFFIIAVGGSFEILDKVGVFKEIISKVVKKFAGKKNLLICAVSFVFMFFGSVLGMFEEIVTMVPIVVTLSYTLGWDSLMGLGMSLLSICFGFTVAISNPFTVGLAQRLAGVPMFSGALLRVALFLLLYSILCIFLIRYAKKIDKNPEKSLVYNEDRNIKSRYYVKDSQQGNMTHEAASEEKKNMKKASNLFLICIGAMSILIAVASIIPELSNYTLPVIALIYLVAGIGGGIAARLKLKEIFRTFIKGVSGILPGILLLLMALSVTYIIKSGGIMDTVVFNASALIQKTSPEACVFLLYGLVLLMEFFIGSASAKAFLLIPIIIPLADMIGLTRQTAIQAFCFGDGFSNIIYPTNAVLLISLGLTTVSYPKWIRWTIKLQLLVMLITCILLGIAVFIRY